MTSSLVRRILVLAAGLAAGLVVATAAEAASLQAAHRSAPPGGIVRVSGEGFAGGERVALTIDARPVGQAEASGAGLIVDVAATVPGDLLPGRHVLVAHGGQSGTRASLTIEVRTDWAMAGFRAGLAGSNPFTVGIGWQDISSLQRTQRITLPGPMQGQVVIARHRAFMTWLGREPDRRSLVAVDLRKGIVAWFSHPEISNVQSDSVAVAYGNVYVSEDDGLAVYPQDCQPSSDRICTATWRAETGVALSSPTIYRERVYAAGGGRLYAFPARCAASTCAPLWSTAAPGEPHYAGVGQPAIYKNTIYVNGAGGRLYGFPLDCHTDCPPSGHITLPEPVDHPVVSDNRVFSATDEGLVVHRAACLTGGDCLPLWHGLGPRGRASRSINAPSVADRTVIAHFAAQTAAYDVDCARDGRECPPLWTSPAWSPLRATHAAIADGVAWTQQGVLRAFPLRCRTDGGECDSTTFLDPYHPNDGIKFGGSPAIVDGSIWVLNGGYDDIEAQGGFLEEWRRGPGSSSRTSE